MKYVVQTSVLSKRWIDIWKSIPFLNFNRDSFSEDRKDSFIMFVDMVIFFRKECNIQMFNLQWMNSAYDTSVVMNVKRWSLGAVKCNVKEFWLLITQCHDSTYEIPHRLLNCKSLGKLVIGMSGHAEYADIILPSSMSLPQLKTLAFFGLSITNAESFTRLFSSSPVLESLCAPNLEVFTCRSFLSRDFSLEICSPLSGVSFTMKLEAKTEDENAEAYSKLPSTEKDVYAKRMMKFLGAVYMVKAMRLSPGFLESNLANVGDDWDAGLSFPEMLPCLKLVQIKKVEGCDNELKFLSFLLKNATTLKKVVLYPRSTIKSPKRVKRQFRDKLRALPRASSHIRMEWPATKSIRI
ncbi:hypothetical protein C5167_025600 [Papaver somniferum]|uniref:FBD domain-containing protein n=1 Tax=Papaver somniferum TaxID=3469 RepID=A0A4Y7JVR0_PAPSO|nr:hypothetical protein C5167_025600 [Papaver somniferum]